MFMTRLFSSAILVIIALVTLLRGSYLLAAILVLISLVAYYELCRVCKVCSEKQKVNSPLVVGYTGIAF